MTADSRDELWTALSKALGEVPGVHRPFSRTRPGGDDSDWKSLAEPYQPVEGAAEPPSLAWPGSGGVMALWELPEGTTSMADEARNLGSYFEEQGADVRPLHEGDTLSVLQVLIGDRGERVVLAYARRGELSVQLAWIVHYAERDALVESGELNDAESDSEAETEAVVAALRRYCAGEPSR